MLKKYIGKISCLLFILCILMAGLPELMGCGSPSSASQENDFWDMSSEESSTAAGHTGGNASGEKDSAVHHTGGNDSKESEQEENVWKNRKEIPGLIYEKSMELSYAEQFQVDYYEGGYTLLKTKVDENCFLVVPEGKEVPQGLEDDIVVVKRPIQNLYLVASSVMDLFAALDGMDAIAFSGLQENDWYVDAAKAAMKKGKLVYAGKYNKPDYELLVSGKCSLAIENTMITHSPEVVEKLQDFQIPVMIECSSYESHPLGRVEWIKFFGTLLGKEKQAEQIFEQQVSIMEQAASDEKTDKTVAFFFITSNGLVQVRQSNDYVPKMIELAGGKYIFEDLGDPDSRRSTFNMQQEEFYKGAKDANYLVYNSSIDGGVRSIEELLGKCELLADFKAVKEGNVYCTTRDMYQQSLSIGYLIGDIHAMLQGDKDGEMKYLFHLK